MLANAPSRHAFWDDSGRLVAVRCMKAHHSCGTAEDFHFTSLAGGPYVLFFIYNNTLSMSSHLETGISLAINFFYNVIFIERFRAEKGSHL